MKNNSKSKTKKKHLEYSDRIKINFYINQNFSVNKIAKELNKSPSIICREIQRNIIVKEGNPLLKGILCSRQIERGPETLCNKCQKAAYCHLTKRYYDCHKAQEMADKRQKEKTSKMSFSHENLKQIEDLNVLNGKQGVYLLVLDRYRACYVGQSDDMRRRIMRHWSRNDYFTGSGIDMFKAHDTTRIYAAVLKENHRIR